MTSSEKPTPEEGDGGIFSVRFSEISLKTFFLNGVLLVLEGVGRRIRVEFT